MHEIYTSQILSGWFYNGGGPNIKGCEIDAPVKYHKLLNMQVKWWHFSQIVWDISLESCVCMFYLGPFSIKGVQYTLWYDLKYVHQGAYLEVLRLLLSQLGTQSIITYRRKKMIFSSAWLCQQSSWNRNSSVVRPSSVVCLWHRLYLNLWHGFLSNLVVASPGPYAQTCFSFLQNIFFLIF